MLYIKNATVYASDGTIESGAVLIEGSRIVAVGRAADVACPDGAQVVDAGGLLLTPGSSTCSSTAALATISPPTQRRFGRWPKACRVTA